MRIKSNMMLTILLFALIPIILLSIFNKSSMISAEEQSVMNKVESTMQMQSQYLNNYFDQLILKTRSLIGQEYILKYLSAVNSGEDFSDDNDTNKKLKSTTELCLSNFAISDLTIENVCLIDVAGNVVYSSEKFYNQEILEQTLKSQSVYSTGGFSEIYLDTEKAQPSIVFSYVKDIYTSDDVFAGKLVTIYNTSVIQNVDKNSKVFKTSHVFCVDSNGIIMEFPYNFINRLSQSGKYGSAQDFITKVINNKDQSVNTFHYYNDSGDDMIIYSTRVSGSGWSFFMTIKSSECTAGIVSARIKMNIFAVLIAIIVVALTVLYVNHYTRPINEMLHTLHKKQRGDMFVRFQVSVNNEFAEISEAFNVMIDDISESEQRYRTVVEMSENIIFEYNMKKNIVRFSDNFNAKFSFRAKTEKYEDSFFVNCSVHSEDKSAYIKTLNTAFKKSNNCQGEFRFKNIYGDYIWFLIRATMLYARDGTPFKIIGVMLDIDRAKSNELRLLQRANYDALTKLFNRETFEKRLVNAFELSSMRKERDAVLFIDLDDFKHFNDDYGHACGDEVLKFVATSICKLVEGNGFAGRYGGDEFVICLTSQNSEQEAEQFSKALIAELQKGFFSQVINQHLSLNCSIGISFFSQSGNNIDTIIEEADEAMYTVKKRGKSNYAIYKK